MANATSVCLWSCVSLVPLAQGLFELPGTAAANHLRVAAVRCMLDEAKYETGSKRNAETTERTWMIRVQCFES